MTHKSKLGKDEKVIVLGIKVKDQDPKDLSPIIESKLDEDVLDVEVLRPMRMVITRYLRSKKTQ